MNESSRQERIIRTSVIGILVNLLIAAVKIMIGTLASSIAIVSEGINNATDAGSSFLTYTGRKLSGKHPDENTTAIVDICRYIGKFVRVNEHVKS